MMPFKLFQWIEENKALLQPPVGAKILFEESDFIIMVVGGPNRRSDYHINTTEEFFYQLKGDMVLKVDDNGTLKDIPIREGEIFLLPGNMPHSPQRMADTVGLVIEKRRTVDQVDKLRWYCENTACEKKIFEKKLYVGQSENPLDLGSALKPVIEEFYGNETLRTCSACSTVSRVPQ